MPRCSTHSSLWRRAYPSCSDNFFRTMTLEGTHIFHLGKRNIILKHAFKSGYDMLVPSRIKHDKNFRLWKPGFNQACLTGQDVIICTYHKWWSLVMWNSQLVKRTLLGFTSRKQRFSRYFQKHACFPKSEKPSFITLNGELLVTGSHKHKRLDATDVNLPTNPVPSIGYVVGKNKSYISQTYFSK